MKIFKQTKTKKLNIYWDQKHTQLVRFLKVIVLGKICLWPLDIKLVVLTKNLFTFSPHIFNHQCFQSLMTFNNTFLDILIALSAIKSQERLATLTEENAMNKSERNFLQELIIILKFFRDQKYI